MPSWTTRRSRRGWPRSGRSGSASATIPATARSSRCWSRRTPRAAPNCSTQTAAAPPPPAAAPAARSVETARYALLDAAISRLVQRHGGVPRDKVEGLEEVGALGGLTPDEVATRVRRHRLLGPSIGPERRRQIRALLDEFGRLTGAAPPPTLLALLGLLPTRPSSRWTPGGRRGVRGRVSCPPGGCGPWSTSSSCTWESCSRPAAPRWRPTSTPWRSRSPTTCGRACGPPCSSRTGSSPTTTPTCWPRRPNAGWTTRRAAAVIAELAAELGAVVEPVPGSQTADGQPKRPRGAPAGRRVDARQAVRSTGGGGGTGRPEGRRGRARPGAATAAPGGPAERRPAGAAKIGRRDPPPRRTCCAAHGPPCEPAAPEAQELVAAAAAAAGTSSVAGQARALADEVAAVLADAERRVSRGRGRGGRAAMGGRGAELDDLARTASDVVPDLDERRARARERGRAGGRAVRGRARRSGGGARGGAARAARRLPRPRRRPGGAGAARGRAARPARVGQCRAGPARRRRGAVGPVDRRTASPTACAGCARTARGR